ncbi:MAG: hypothetical protein NTV34_09455 [Proteobacteria bacterium]|nr:hypothetical protein [Pseudomonadota bacterium]
MMSLSLGFHVASALALIFAIWQLARLRVQVGFLRRWANPNSAGILVGDPVQSLVGFCRAHDIPVENVRSAPALPKKISLKGLAALHFVHGIKEVIVPANPADPIVFKIKVDGAALEVVSVSEQGRLIETDFGQAFVVRTVEL